MISLKDIKSTLCVVSVGVGVGAADIVGPLLVKCNYRQVWQHRNETNFVVFFSFQFFNK